MQVLKGYGRRVSAIRKDLGMSKREFAVLTLSPKASAKNIGRIEAEEVIPLPETLNKISAVTGVSSEWVRTGQIDLGDNAVVRVPGLGRRIEKLRKQRGMSCLALAREAGLGNTSKNIRRIEQGEVRPRTMTLRKIAPCLGTTVEKLVRV